jgi:hypothetical protein
MDSSQKFFMDEERISYQAKDYSSENVISEDTRKVINLYLQLSVEEKITFNRHLREDKGYIL